MPKLSTKRKKQIKHLLGYKSPIQPRHLKRAAKSLSTAGKAWKHLAREFYLRRKKKALNKSYLIKKTRKRYKQFSQLEEL